MIVCRDSDVGRAMTHPDDVAGVFLPMMLTHRETLCAMYLDNSRKIITAQRIAIGGEDFVTCEPRLLFRPAVALDASFILISHNHPSGNPTPSRADLETTKLIEVCAAMLGIGYIDHLVITHTGRYRSIAEFNEKGF